jgi:hypothetical protein
MTPHKGVKFGRKPKLSRVEPPRLPAAPPGLWSTNGASRADRRRTNPLPLTPIAPWAPRRAARRAADVRMGEPFANQYSASIPSADR